MNGRMKTYTLITLLMVISGIVFVGQLFKINMWLFICLYWAVLFVKNLFDYRKGATNMPKLELGQLLCTASVSELMSDNTDFSEHISKALNRYLNGDWGDLCDEDKLQNDEAMKNGNDRILASYEHSDHDDWKIWIITEWDRSATTILFPHEY